MPEHDHDHPSVRLKEHGICPYCGGLGRVQAVRRWFKCRLCDGFGLWILD